MDELANKENNVLISEFVFKSPYIQSLSLRDLFFRMCVHVDILAVLHQCEFQFWRVGVCMRQTLLQ